MENKINTLELNLASAKDLNNLNLFAKMDVYAVVFISGDPLHNQKTKSPVDTAAGTNPAWNFPVKLTFNESLLRRNRLTVEIRLRCVRSLAVDRDIGSVNVPLKELLDHSGDGKTFQHVSYQVRKPSGKPKGTLNFSYKFGEKLIAPAAPVNPKAEHVNAYSYPAPTVGYNPAPYPAAYPPPPLPYGGYQQPQAGYGYPPQPVYGYPQQPGYVYPPQPVYGYPPQDLPAKNNFGMGL